eukprot:14126935-Alexandrium_andersonii.AAC.1
MGGPARLRAVAAVKQEVRGRAPGGKAQTGVERKRGGGDGAETVRSHAADRSSRLAAALATRARTC